MGRKYYGETADQQPSLEEQIRQIVREELAARERQPKQWINESGVYAGSITSKHPYGDSLNGETQPQNILAECGSEM
jgi:hypothetical protein